MSKFFEDIALTVTIILGFAIALYLSYALVVQEQPYPPTLISMFAGVSLAAVIYRFMGGLTSSELAMGAIKLGGSAAFVIFFIYFVGDRLREEVRPMRRPTPIASRSPSSRSSATMHRPLATSAKPIMIDFESSS